jgi:hypothetical protein
MKLRGNIEIKINGEIVLSSDNIIIESEDGEVELIVEYDGCQYIVQLPEGSI